MPTILLIGGPNGAGKTTTAKRLLPALSGSLEFVNADVIAEGLSAFHPELAAMQAGKIMLERLDYLAEQGRDFAFESTLAARTFAPFVAKCKEREYKVIVVYVWLSSPELAVQRVATRVERGGHHVPTPVVERRYWRGLQNFFQLYRPLADEWYFLNNSGAVPQVVAKSGADHVTIVKKEDLWQHVQQIIR